MTVSDAAESPGTGAHRFLDAHQAAVVVVATARLVPGPDEDPDEAGSPGAREAGVVDYIDGLLSALDSTPEWVYLGGPWDEPGFLPLSHLQRVAWTRRVADWQAAYRAGLARLDELAGGDFCAVPADRQDAVLADAAIVDFVDLLFGHTTEGLYGDPRYGGNRDLSGWRDIRFAGPRQPAGWTPAEVTDPTGSDPVADSPMVTDFLAFLEDPPD